MAHKIEITPEQIKELEVLSSRGLTHEQMWNYLGMSRQTFYERIKENPEISEAIKRGKSKGIAKIANGLFAQAESGNLTAIIFYLKTQAGWKETTVNEHQGKDGAPIEFAHLTELSDEERFNRAQEILNRARDRRAADTIGDGSGDS